MFFVKRKKEKEPKEKRKGRRGSYTFLLTLSVILIFVLLYFLMPANVVPPPMQTPVSSPTLPPLQLTTTNGGGTAMVVAPGQLLLLEALCSPGEFSSLWRVTNWNPYAVTFTFVTKSLSTSMSGTLTVPAANGTESGTVEFRSFMEPGGVITTISVDNQLHASAAGSTEPCAPIATPT